MQNMSHQDFKTSCSKLSVELKENGVKIPHTKLLNMVARSLGYKDYNTFKGIQDIKEKNSYRIYVDDKNYINCYRQLKNIFNKDDVKKYDEIFVKRNGCNYIEIDLTKINSNHVKAVEKRLLDSLIYIYSIKRVEHIVFQDISEDVLTHKHDIKEKQTVSKMENEFEKYRKSKFLDFVKFLFYTKKRYVKSYIKCIKEDNICVDIKYIVENTNESKKFSSKEYFIVPGLKSEKIIENAEIYDVFYDGKNSYLNTSQGKVYFDLTYLMLNSFESNMDKINTYEGEQDIIFIAPPGRGKTALIETIILPKLKNKKIAVIKYGKNEMEYYDNASNIVFVNFDEFIKRQKEFDIVYISLPSVDFHLTNVQINEFVDFYLTDVQINEFVNLLNEKNHTKVILDVQGVDEKIKDMFVNQVINKDIGTFDYNTM